MVEVTFWGGGGGLEWVSACEGGVAVSHAAHTASPPTRSHLTFLVVFLKHILDHCCLPLPYLL